MDPNRRFAELAGIKPIGKTIFPPMTLYPDFADPIEVLKVVRERKDWPEFVARLRMFGLAMIRRPSCVAGKESYYISDNLLLATDALRDKWIEWKEEKDGQR